jgi:hypothetical protein
MTFENLKSCGDRSIGRTPVPTGDGGSNPTSSLQIKKLAATPHCRLLTAKEANAQLESWHYLGAVRGILFSVGHEEGCCVFTNCRSRHYEKTHPGVVELSRMVGMPDHKWAMSSLMAQAVRECKKRGYKEIITYADPWNNNTGKVYLAAGWVPCGASGKDTVYMLDNERVARRTFYDRHGTQSRAKMKEIYGDRLRFEDAPPKPIFKKQL